LAEVTETKWHTAETRTDKERLRTHSTALSFEVEVDVFETWNINPFIVTPFLVSYYHSLVRLESPFQH